METSIDSRKLIPCDNFLKYEINVKFTLATNIFLQLNRKVASLQLKKKCKTNKELKCCSTFL